MGEVIPFPVPEKASQKGGEILQKIEADIVASEISQVLRVERVPIFKKIFSILLTPEDYSKMVIERDFLGNPEDYTNHESEALLQRVANDNSAPVKQKAA